MAIELPRIGWENEPSKKTPLSAENLKLMEDNAENAINQAITQVQTNGYRKTFTMGDIKTDAPGDTFTLIKKGPIVEISAWISPSTLSKPLSG